MSESRKNKKYSNFKEQKRIILAKKDDKPNDSKRESTAARSSQPKILLKSKEKDQPTIASREKSEESAETKMNILSNKEPKEAPVAPDTGAQQMLTPITLITSHAQVDPQAFDQVIVEQNSDFLVVAVIGTKNVGKSTILNLLLTDLGSNPVETIFKEKEGVFKMKSRKHNFSTLPVTEGIQMYITKDRIFLLDCMPQNQYNQYKKDYVMNELDDLKMLIFLLSVCHVIIVVQDETVSPNFLRLLQIAEMMKLNYEKEGGDEHFPNVIFVKNRASHIDFQHEQKQLMDKLYKQIFKNSKLKIFQGNIDDEHKFCVNCFQFPEVNFNKSQFYTGHPDVKSLIMEFRRRVFTLSPRNPLVAIQGHHFTEKLWCQLCISVWETHNNNYFLRKYESLKEKFNLHNHINTAGEVIVSDKTRDRGDVRGDRDRGYLNFVDA